MPHVAIVTHPRDEFEQRPFCLREIAAVWREHGHRVTVVSGCDKAVEADIGFLHLDLTVIPPEYLSFMNRFPVGVNVRVANISKRTFSMNLLNREDDWDGPVIVKTNLNYGGISEYRLSRGSRLERKIRSALYRLSWRWRDHLSSWNYPVLSSLREVPPGVWLNRNLIVERFLPERDGKDYCLRVWSFLGDRETHNQIWSAQPVVKSNNIHRREAIGEVPPQLRQIRADLGFDFGKFDYGVVNGRTVLYDVNRTPTMGALQSTGYRDRAELFAQGLDSILKAHR